MKNSIIIIALFVLSFQTYAQQNEGIVYFTRTSYWTKLVGSLPFLSQQEKDRQTYMLGGKDDWKEYTLLYFSEKESRYTHSDERSAESEGYAERKEEFNIRRNFDKNTMNDALEMLGKVYLIEDSLQVPNWKILNDIKDVAGHICMKAMIQDTVKKQKIIAWFAQDIPVSAGPERLYGLPGLILALDINDGAVTIEASRIESKKLTTELDLPKKQKGKKITDLLYQEMLRKYIQEKIKAEQYPYWAIRY